MQAQSKLLEAVQQGNPQGSCPICHGTLTPGSMNRLRIALELGYEAGFAHGQDKVQWVYVLAGSAVASVAWALVWLAARAL